MSLRALHKICLRTFAPGPSGRCSLPLVAHLDAPGHQGHPLYACRCTLCGLSVNPASLIVRSPQRQAARGPVFARWATPRHGASECRAAQWGRVLTCDSAEKPCRWGVFPAAHETYGMESAIFPMIFTVLMRGGARSHKNFQKPGVFQQNRHAASGRVEIRLCHDRYGSIWMVYGITSPRGE